MRMSLSTCVGVVATAAALAIAAEAAAQDDHDITFPAGIACAFELGVDIGPGGPQITHTYPHNPTRSLSSGRGYELTFTNLSSGAKLTTRADGAVTSTVSNADGSQTTTLTGHNILIMYPTDVPAGPSTTLYVGRVTFTNDTSDPPVTTLNSTSGRATDICAALS